MGKSRVQPSPKISRGFLIMRNPMDNFWAKLSRRRQTCDSSWVRVLGTLPHEEDDTPEGAEDIIPLTLQQLRLEVMIRDMYNCLTPGCVSTARLEVHHTIYRRCEIYKLSEFQTLCQKCHIEERRSPNHVSAYGCYYPEHLVHENHFV